MALDFSAPAHEISFYCLLTPHPEVACQFQHRRGSRQPGCSESGRGLVDPVTIKTTRRLGAHLRAVADRLGGRNPDPVVATQDGERYVHRREQILAVLDADRPGLDPAGDMRGIALQERLLVDLGKIPNRLFLGPLRK